MAPRDREGAHQRAATLLAQLPLQELRQARHLTQVALAQRLRSTQAQVSKLERRADMYVSSLRGYIEALGGDLEIVARFPSIAAHLDACGPWRLPAFVDFARDLMGNPDILHDARWCHETLVGVTKDGKEDRFFHAWDRAAEFMQHRGLYSGEGGVLGLAAAYAGWPIDYDALTRLDASIRHEGGGPKDE